MWYLIYSEDVPNSLPLRKQVRPAHLARLQAWVSFEELLALHPEISVDVAGAERHRSPFVRGFVSLPAHGFAPA